MDDDSNEEEEGDDVIGKAVGPLPSVSSKLNFDEEKPTNMKYDLWVVGAGTLGELICQQYKAKYPDSIIIGETLTESRHERLKSYGVTPRLRQDRSVSEDIKSAKNVIISLTPSSVTDYVGAINEAFLLWAGPLGGGNLVFSSSLAVYGDSNGNIVDESFRLDTRSARSTRLIAAEEAILHRGGIVMRLAGLYNDQRGPHAYWLRLAKEGTVIDTNADGLVNLIHYEDAASIMIAAMESSPSLQNQVLIGVDQEVITKEEICRSALASKLFPDSPMPEFASPSGAIGKQCNAKLTRSLLPSWTPKYPSFRKYMRELGGEIVNLEDTQALLEQKEAKKSSLWIPGDELDDEL